MFRADWWRSGTPLVTNAALLLFAALMLEFTRTGAGGFHHFVHGYSETIFAEIALYLGGISLIERCPTDKWTLRIVLLAALATRLIAVFAPPFLSTDVYRYVWDGLVQGARINPFRYIPADSHLAFLRDAHIYPNINRRGYAHTIYPPGSQIIFYAVTRISATVTFMKLAMTGFEAVTCLALIRCLKMLRMPPERVLLYAWHPVCLWEIASSGHVDAAALTFISLAVLARLEGRDRLAAGWLGAAALVKLYPIALLPAFLRRGRAAPVWIAAAVVTAGYSLYLSAGAAVFGFLPNYAREEGLESGTRYFPLALVERVLHMSIPAAAYVIACAAALAGLAWWSYRRSTGPAACVSSGLVMATALTLCFSPHYPWYFLWLLPFLTLWPWRPAFFLVLAPTYLLATRLGLPGEPMYRLNSILYGGFFLLLAWDWACGRLWNRGPHALTGTADHNAWATAATDRAAGFPRRLRTGGTMSTQMASRYFEKPGDQLSVLVEQEPVCLYLEVTNRCNLLCTTCPRTYEELEPEADMTWPLFTKIVDQVPNIQRVVLHGVGEPMLVKNLPEMVAYLKHRGVYVLFNTNGTLLTEKNGQALIEAGLDELRVSLDAAEPAVFQMVRGKDMFDRIVTNVRRFRRMQAEQGIELPRVSLWLTGLRETLNQLEAFVRIADSVDVREVYLQRLVFFTNKPNGLARAESALFEKTSGEEEAMIARATALSKSLGIVFNASGATEPETSIKQRRPHSPWSLCRRPWSLMYFTATGRAIPCCIAPFSMHGYGSFTLGDATQQTLREIWNGPEYQDFRHKLLSPEPPRACANCGMRWSL